MSVLVRLVSWIAGRVGHHRMACPYCGRLNIDPTDYCPGCGL
jgi:uncharacterized OB-fold protein